MSFKISVLLICLSMCRFQFVNCECQKYEMISDCFYNDQGTPAGKDIVTFICSEKRDGQVFLDPYRIQCSNISPSPENEWPGTIDFKNCQFSEMPKINFFEKFSSLHTFIMSNVDLQKISSNTFRKATNIVNLSLAQNRLEEIPPVAFVNAQKLQNLNFSNNSIERIDLLAFLGLNELVSLNLPHNNLTRLDEQVFKDLTNLKHLNFSYNQINGLEANVLTLPNLQDLDLAHNDLTVINGDIFSQVRDLERLNLSFNPIAELKPKVFLYLIHLQHLSLRRTNLSSIARGTFSHQQNLVSLDLSENTLKIMDFKLFLPILPDLMNLQLASNQLGELPHFRNSLLPQLQELNIQNNNFNCSYLEYFMESVNWETLQMPIDLNLVDFDKQNIRGVNCDEISQTTKSRSNLD